MKYFRKYPRVLAGTHSPDEVLYRLDGGRPCELCGERTDWVDVKLVVAVCSEECRYDFVTGKRRAGTAAPRPPALRASRLVVVQRNRADVYERLVRRYEGVATVLEDRRYADRRRPANAELRESTERRRGERRRVWSGEDLRSWMERGFCLVQASIPSAVRPA